MHPEYAYLQDNKYEFKKLLKRHYRCGEGRPLSRPEVSARDAPAGQGPCLHAPRGPALWLRGSKPSLGGAQRRILPPESSRLRPGSNSGPDPFHRCGFGCFISRIMPGRLVFISNNANTNSSSGGECRHLVSVRYEGGTLLSAVSA